MNVSTRTLLHYTVLEVTGDIDNTNAMEFYAQAVRAMETAPGDVVVNMNNVSLFSSHGLAALVKLWKYVTTHYANFHVVTSSPYILALFDNTNMGTIISIFDSEERFAQEVLGIDDLLEFKREQDFRHPPQS